ncbi:Phospholipase D3 [Gryllus bimaculatus]|nr:Phospholipase D3 [Gryllus bimaculatus]
MDQCPPASGLAAARDADGRLDGGAEVESDLWDSRFMLRGDHDADALHNARWGPRGWFKPSCVPISVILVLIVLVVLLPLMDGPAARPPPPAPPPPPRPRASRALRRLLQFHIFRISLVESIPEGLQYPSGSASHPSTHQTWLDLIQAAEYSIEIASFYWTLQQGEVYPDPSSKQGEQVFQSLLEAGTKRNVSVFIAQNKPEPKQPNIDTDFLASKGAAQVRSVDFQRLMGGGVLHTKLWIIDRTHVYVGSANMDWRSLAQVKELGAVLYNCTCLANDIGKIFDVYWSLGQPNAQIPGMWPDTLSTPYGIQTPMNVSLNGTDSLVYVSWGVNTGHISDKQLGAIFLMAYIWLRKKYDLLLDTPENFLQTRDLKINYQRWREEQTYERLTRGILWTDIDDALRAAAINRNIHVRLLISLWNHTRPAIPHFLNSLRALSGAYKNVLVEVKMFVVPSTPEQKKIPFARVNHNKYMVTDKTAYIGTSNWSGDYFINTAGVGLVVSESNNDSDDNSLRAQLQSVFERDWNSSYAQPVPSVQ